MVDKIWQNTTSSRENVSKWHSRSGSSISMITSTARIPVLLQQLAPNFRQRDCEAARGPREGRGRAAGGLRKGREMSKLHPRDPAVEKNHKQVRQVQYTWP